MEKHRIGGPAYAPIIDTIRKREYATLEQRRFKPTEVGLAVCDLLSEHFPTVVNLEFTASMEDELDEIEEKRSDWVQITDKFYRPFSERLREADAVAERVVIADEPTDEDCPECGLAKLVIKTGRFGKFIACPRYPECTYRRSITRKVDAKCPECGGDMVQRRSKKGRVFYGCARYPECEFVSWNPPSGVDCPKCASFATSRRVRAGVSISVPTPNVVTNGLKNGRVAPRVGRRRAGLLNEITVIGAGLAGSEAAWQAARLGVRVRLVEMRPEVNTPAHSTSCFAELVCSNSLGSDREGTASGLLKEELRALGSVIMRCADTARVPAGQALAVDRALFSAGVTREVESAPEIEIVRGERDAYLMTESLS